MTISRFWSYRGQSGDRVYSAVGHTEDSLGTVSAVGHTEDSLGTVSAMGHTEDSVRTGFIVKWVIRRTVWGQG